LLTGSAAAYLRLTINVDLLRKVGATKSAIIHIVVTHPEVPVVSVVRIVPLPIAVRAPRIETALEPWLRARLETISRKTKLAEAIRYAISRWAGLSRFLDDGRIEIDNNTVERSIRPLALTRNNSLFAGSDGGGEHWAILASLIETAKLNDVDPRPT
jgi:hypothetical protein